MMRKLTFLAGFAAGYVVGARAGRESYDRIADKAQQAWKDHRVQEKVGQAQDVVKEKASGLAEDVKDRAGSSDTSADASADSADSGAGTPSMPSSDSPEAPSEAPTGRVSGYSGGPMS